MPDLTSIDLQIRALGDIEQASSAASAGNKEAAARLTATAQIKATLANGAALRELAQALRSRG
ncbi:hypothetical protein [[Kitasatospora] papulosa]|uniref:hypothetical protein n=1 Tax=[Kitasatospora] papulosa TaxID=1464011 RepID=UPI0036A9F25A